MQFFHKCKNERMETLIAELTQRIEVLAFSVEGGRPVPHVSMVGGLSNFVFDKLICRTCGETVELRNAYSSCVLTGGNYPVTQLVVSNGFVYYPVNLYKSNDTIKAMMGTKSTDLYKFLGGK